VSTAKLEGLKDLFDFSYYGSLENHRAGREASLERFITDFAADRREGGRPICRGRAAASAVRRRSV